MRNISFDFETFFSKKLKYTLKTSIAEQYCKSELFDPYMISVWDGASGWVGHPKDFNWSAFDGARGIAHNAMFDRSVLNEMHRRGMCPKPGFAEYHCTANMTAYLANRRSLDLACEHLLGVKVDKSAREDADRKHWPQDFSPEQQQIMLNYAQKDAIYTWELWDKHSHRWPELERRLSNLTIEQGMRGVQINTDLLNDYILWSHDAKMAIEKILPWLQDDDSTWDEFTVSPTSTKCISEQCKRTGIPCPPVKSEDEEAYELWEVTYAKSHPWIRCLSAWRSINKLYRTFMVMKSRIRDDNTMPFALLYFGAHTGRFSGTARLNMQNMRQKPVFILQDGMVEIDPKREELFMESKRANGVWPLDVLRAIDFRALFIPRPGKKMIVSDLAQIEPRVLKWLAGDFKTLDMIRSGTMSIYEAHARSSMGWSGGKLQDEAPPLYKLAKARELALGYGAAWEKFVTMAQTLSQIDITVGDPEFETVIDKRTGLEKQVSGWGQNSRRIVKDYRANNPLVCGENGIWRKLENAMRSSVGDDLVLTLPSGRKMRYEKIRCERRVEPDPETGLPKSKSVYTALIGHKRKIFYGGKLTENITQATARDVLAEQIVDMESSMCHNLWSSHDEAIQEVDQSVDAMDVQNVMSRTPVWLEGCPIAAKAKEVKHYEK